MHCSKLYDPFYPEYDPAYTASLITYKQWLQHVKMDPQTINQDLGNTCCGNGWQTNYLRSYNVPLGHSCQFKK